MFWMYIYYEFCLVSAKRGCRGDMFAIIMALSSMFASSEAEQSVFYSQQLLAFFQYLHPVSLVMYACHLVMLNNFYMPYTVSSFE